MTAYNGHPLPPILLSRDELALLCFLALIAGGHSHELITDQYSEQQFHNDLKLAWRGYCLADAHLAQREHEHRPNGPEPQE